MHTHAFAEDSVLKRILQLLWQLRDRRIDIRSRPRSSSLRTGKHPSYYKARFAVPAAASPLRPTSRSEKRTIKTRVFEVLSLAFLLGDLFTVFLEP